MPKIGPLELIIILVIVLLVFGVGRLPQVGSALGKSMRSFKRGVTGEEEPDQVAEEDEVAPPASKSKSKKR